MHIPKPGNVKMTNPMERVALWVKKGNSVSSLDKQDIYYPEYDDYHVVEIVKGVQTVIITVHIGLCMCLHH